MRARCLLSTFMIFAAACALPALPGAAGAASPAVGNTAAKGAGKDAAKDISKPGAAKSWHPPGCPIPVGGPRGKTKMQLGGPCEGDWTVEADCQNEIDDLTFTSKRKIRDGVEMVVYINVERYAGAGTYKPPNDLYVSVMKGKTIWRWSTNDFEATIGPGSRHVEVKNVKLEPELLLVGCTGPQTNYQCDGRGDDREHMASMTTLTGSLYCKGAAKRVKDRE